jgi:hypothetical protein
MKNRSRHSLSFRAFVRPAVCTLQYINVSPADRIERAHLVLAVLEGALLVRRDRLPERPSNVSAELRGRLHCEHLQAAEGR